MNEQTTDERLAGFLDESRQMLALSREKEAREWAAKRREAVDAWAQAWKDWFASIESWIPSPLRPYIESPLDLDNLTDMSRRSYLEMPDHSESVLIQAPGLTDIRMYISGSQLYGIKYLSPFRDWYGAPDIYQAAAMAEEAYQEAEERRKEYERRADEEEQLSRERASRSAPERLSTATRLLSDLAAYIREILAGESNEY